MPHNLKDTFGKNKYIDVIRNADICLIFTRLRTDLNVLKTCKINTDISKNSPYGCNEQDTVVHLLLRCRKFDETRSEFASQCEVPRHKLSNEHYMLKCILYLECSGNRVNVCCRFISKVYDSREKLRSQPMRCLIPHCVLRSLVMRILSTLYIYEQHECLCMLEYIKNSCIYV